MPPRLTQHTSPFVQFEELVQESDTPALHCPLSTHDSVAPPRPPMPPPPPPAPTLTQHCCVVESHVALPHESPVLTPPLLDPPEPLDPLDPPLELPEPPPLELLLPGGTGTTLPSGRTSTEPPSGRTSTVPPLPEPPELPVPVPVPAPVVKPRSSSSDAPPHPDAGPRLAMPRSTAAKDRLVEDFMARRPPALAALPVT
jgi:hypothetical protein